MPYVKKQHKQPEVDLDDLLPKRPNSLQNIIQTLNEANEAIQLVADSDVTLIDFLKALAGVTATSKQALMDCIQRNKEWSAQDPMASDLFEETIKAYNNLRIGAEYLDKASKLVRR